MTELFLTWKQPSATGSSLFEKEQIKKIEMFLDQARKQQMELLRNDLSKSISPESRNQPMGQAALLLQVDKLLGLTKQRTMADPSDGDAIKRVETLNRLKVVLGNEKLPNNILPSIQQTLVGFTTKEMERLKNLEQAQDPRFSQGQRRIQTPPVPTVNNYNHNAPTRISTPPVQASPFSPQQFQQMANLMNNLNKPNNQQSYPQPNNYSQPQPFVANNRPNNSQFDLMGMLQGINSVPKHSGDSNGISFPLQNMPIGPATTQNRNQQQPTPPVDPSLISSLMSAGLIAPNTVAPPTVSTNYPKIELNSSSLNIPRPYLIRQLYEDLPKSCSTCGKRFPDTYEGRKAREEHLDWHFRMNKKLRDENWTQMRSWFFTKVEWVNYRDEEEMPNSGPQQEEGYNSDDDYSPDINSVGGSNNLKSGKIDFESLQAKYVLAPSDKTIANQPCPICKEKFNSVWSDDVEDWVWKNAVEIKGKIFHATCYEESERNGGGLVQRILAQQDTKPAVTTPAITSQAPTAIPNPLASIGLPNGIDLASILSSVSKRKLEDEDPNQAKRPKFAN